MPAAWVSAGVGALSLLNGMSSGNKGAPTNSYTPANADAANSGWLTSFNQVGNIANNAYGTANPAYLQSLNAANAIDYSPYLTAANRAGSMYGNLGNVAYGQMGQYGAGAQAMQDAQGAILNRAFDPNMAAYNQAANNLTGQVNAQQAARGLGNSPVGAMELGNTLGNFNTGWNTAQLQNEMTGIQGAGMANQAAGQDLAAMLASGSAGAGYALQGSQIPITAQQYVAGMPATNAASYVNNLGNIEQMYGQQAGLAIPYLTGGQGAQQFNTNFNAQQNAAGMNALLNGLKGGGSSGPDSWLSNLFSSGNQDYYSQTGLSPTDSYGTFSGGDLSYLSDF